ENSLVMFGRSPFLATVDVDRIHPSHKTAGFNEFGRLHRVDTLWFYDAFYDGFKPPGKLFIPYWFNTPGERYAPRRVTRPYTEAGYQDGSLVLGHVNFTPSVALNWAILEGFSSVYLVGIDHVETDTKFIHHDGTPCNSNLTPTAHRQFKDYVKRCADH